MKAFFGRDKRLSFLQNLQTFYGTHPACYFFYWRNSPIVGKGPLIIEVSRSHSDTLRSVGLLWTSDQPDAETFTSQHITLTRDILTPDGIRTHSLSKRAAADPRLRSRGHWDRRAFYSVGTIFISRG
jgi:hypothetical protein